MSRPQRHYLRALMIAGFVGFSSSLPTAWTHTQATNSEAISMAINCDRGVCELLLEHQPMSRSVCITRQSLIPMTSASGGPPLLIWLERSQLSSKVV